MKEKTKKNIGNKNKEKNMKKITKMKKVRK